MRPAAGAPRAGRAAALPQRHLRPPLRRPPAVRQRLGRDGLRAAARRRRPRGPRLGLPHLGPASHSASALTCHGCWPSPTTGPTAKFRDGDATRLGGLARLHRASSAISLRCPTSYPARPGHRLALRPVQVSRLRARALWPRLGPAGPGSWPGQARARLRPMRPGARQAAAGVPAHHGRRRRADVIPNKSLELSRKCRPSRRVGLATIRGARGPRPSAGMADRDRAPYADRPSVSSISSRGMKSSLTTVTS